MDKPSEQRKSAKDWGDVDIGVTNYHPVDNAGKREQLNGLWGVASKEVVGLPESRLLTNCYKKPTPDCPTEKPDLLEEIMEHGPPLMNKSRLPRVF